MKLTSNTPSGRERGRGREGGRYSTDNHFISDIYNVYTSSKLLNNLTGTFLSSCILYCSMNCGQPVRSTTVKNAFARKNTVFNTKNGAASFRKRVCNFQFHFSSHTHCKQLLTEHPQYKLILSVCPVYNAPQARKEVSRSTKDHLNMPVSAHNTHGQTDTAT